MSPTINTEKTNISMSVHAFVSMLIAVITVCIGGVLWTVNLQHEILDSLNRKISLQDFLSWQKELGKLNPKLIIPNMAEYHTAKVNVNDGVAKK